ncbi:DNA/RNA helicase domain-containing protein [Bordetella genomosp. 4]|uniref:DNA/RNA helicase domain-containing protein n=1 Tax=Bordetella genomosp. 4 TaxID=463044 RepID=UPI000B9E6646|nr:DNA/RNA helicase domain-containing protein [Bordetella genomosp. 4]OZI43196.1 ATP-binding protein [Bordetella genomosp. 4]
MIVYEADKKQFLHHTDYDDIENVILTSFKTATGKRVNSSEVRSWRESLNHIAMVLRDDDIPNDMGVAVELHIPQSSKRIDVTLTGRDDAGNKNVVVIELKQWEKAAATDKDAIVVTYLGGGQREVVHPSYQAWSYASLLEGFNEAVYDGGIAIKPCAYLHNYPRDGVIDAPHYSGYTIKAPLFLKGARERQQLRDFIKKHVKYGDSKEILYELANGRIRPSKALADALKGLLTAKPEFVLIDDQKEVFEAALAAGRTASPDAPKVIIIEGGPGTGKTVLAINLLVRLTSSGLLGQYVSKNAAPREVYQSKLVGTITKTKFASLFSGSGRFFDAEPNSYDFLIVDEAHRLNEKSGLYGNLGENQVKELINASACTIFFIDEDQRVTLNDIGTKQAIRDFAKAKGALIEEYELASQFRCSGSDGYLAWLDNTLDIRPTANPVLNVDEYDFQVFDSPQALHDAIEAKNGENKARVVAGYCWPWLSKKNPQASDIVIGDYRRQWNLDKDSSLWIIAPKSIEQVGCIHTCQGLEVDYIGVIIGDDLVVRDGQVVTNAEHRDRHDKTIRGYKTRLKTDPDQARAEVDLIIKNTYRTLMTRGMKGCYVYCTDKETAEYFRSRINEI